MADRNEYGHFVRGNQAARLGKGKASLGHQFLTAMRKDFAKHGAEVIEQVRVADPTTYLRVCAQMVPKEYLVGGLDGGGVTLQVVTGIPEPAPEDDVVAVQARACDHCIEFPSRHRPAEDVTLDAPAAAAETAQEETAGAPERASADLEATLQGLFSANLGLPAGRKARR